jgi:hypothetical protein
MANRGRRKTDKPGWYASIIPAEATRTACLKCGTHSTLIGKDGECLRCRLAHRKSPQA